MRGYRFDKLTSVDDLSLHNEPMPRPERGEVLVRVQAVALNYRDIAPTLGRYTARFRPGLIPCSDAAGEVVEVGAGVRALAPGDRVVSTFHPRWFGGRPPTTMATDVYGAGSDGWLAEYKAVSQESVIRLPEGIEVDEGATLPCAATTAWNALSGPTPVRAGDTVLTLGTGGVSVFAAQLAGRLGARVIATTSADAKAERLLALGADAVVNYSQVPDWGRRVRELTGGDGADCVVEVGGPATVNESLRAVRWGGEVVLIGFLSEENPGIDYFHLKESGATVRAIGVGDRATQEAMMRAWAGSGLRPVIDRTFAFDDAVGAFQHLKDRGHVGKVVIRVAP